MKAAGILTLIVALAAPAFFVNIPCRDDWTIVPMVEKILDGRVPFADLWAPHSEHRLLVPRMILAYWAAWTSWDLRGLPWLDLALVLAGTACLAGLPEKKSVIWKAPYFWAAATFTLSLSALKTVNWPTILNTFLSVALAVGVIACIARGPLSFKRWMFAALIAVFSTFSFGCGVVVWFAVFPLLIIARKSPKAGAITLLWAGSAALSLALYFSGMDLQKHPSLFASIQDMGQTTLFFIIYLGALFYPLPPEFFGILGLGLSGALCVYAFQGVKREESPMAAGLLSVVLFVLGTAFLTALARSRFGASYAIAERYLPISSYFWAALSVWLTLLSEDRPNPFVRPILITLVASILLIAPLHWFNFEDNRAFMDSAAAILKNEKAEPGQLLVLYEEPGVVERGLIILKNRRLSIFR